LIGDACLSFSRGKDGRMLVRDKLSDCTATMFKQEEEKS